MHIVIKFLTTSKFYITSKNQRPVTSPSGKVGGARLTRFMVITLSKCKKKLRGQDGYGWRCERPCRRRVSVRAGSFFEKSNLSLAKILQLLYQWAHRNASFLSLHHELNLATNTVVDWKNFSRDVCAQYLLAHPVTLGGPGIVVEIDESLFVRRKHNVGRVVLEQWVFGGIEVGTPARKGFLVAVARRNAATLIPILQQYVLPGTTVISDCWAAYNMIGNIGYLHWTVNHQIEFVNPLNGACTNHVECYWKNAKLRNKTECGTARTQLDSYLIEYMWRTQFGGNPFQKFVEHVQALYPMH